jgi:glycosyltransferase involved in cell wall biosynthesis
MASTVGADLVTVVLATCNGENVLPEQLQSYVDQTAPPAALIAADDDSTDGSVHLLEEFAARAPFPVHVIRRDRRLGYADNFLAAAELVRTPLAAFSDQDDIWLPDKLARTSAVFSDPTVQLCVHDAFIVSDDARTAVHTSRVPHLGLVRRSLFAGRMFAPHGSRCVFRSSLLAGVPPTGRPRTMYTWPDSHLQEHDEWVFFAARAMGRVVRLDDKLQMFRRHPGAVGYATEQTTGANSRARWLRRPSENTIDCVRRGAISRADYLRALAGRAGPGVTADRMLAEAQAYDVLVRRLDRRLRVCTPGRASVRALGRCVAHLDYGRQRKSGLGWLALVQDCLGLGIPA